MSLLRDINTQAVTICGVLEEMSVPAQQTLSLVPDAVPIAQYEWCADVLWYRVDGDEGVEYEQRLQVISPNGKSMGSTGGNLVMIGPRVRGLYKGPGVPLDQPGEVLFRLELKRPEGDWETVADYPITVKHT